MYFWVKTCAALWVEGRVQMIEFSLPPKWEKREEKWGKTGGREDKN
jgi:hypothetical protein